MSFVGGKLKLKGGDALGAKGGSKKKKSKSKKLSSGELAAAGNGTEDQKALTEGYVIEETEETRLVDRRTPAERRHDAYLEAREKERISKMASKSHRERVQEFNEYLTNLTEHHDIPKVGPG